MLIDYYDEKYLLSGRTEYLYLKTNSFYKNIRHEPAYQKLMAKHKVVYDKYLLKYGDRAILSD